MSCLLKWMRRACATSPTPAGAESVTQAQHARRRVGSDRRLSEPTAVREHVSAISDEPATINESHAQSSFSAQRAQCMIVY